MTTTEATTTALPEGYIIRRMEKQDYEGVVDTLAVLTTVGNVSKKKFDSIIDYWNSNEFEYRGSKVNLYNPHVIVDTIKNEIAATGNIIIEQKLIHDCGLCGHLSLIHI